MQNSDNEISMAVVLFLGFGSAISPDRNRARLIQEFGASRGLELESQVVSLVAEIHKVDVDWTTQSFESAEQMMCADMRPAILTFRKMLFERSLGSSRSIGDETRWSE